MRKATCIAVHFFLIYLFLYLQSKVRHWQNNPASVSFGNSTIIQERQFIIRLPLKRQQPSQLCPLCQPVSQPVSCGRTSLRLKGWRRRPNPSTPPSTAAHCRGCGGDRNDTWHVLYLLSCRAESPSHFPFWLIALCFHNRWMDWRPVQGVLPPLAKWLLG